QLARVAYCLGGGRCHPGAIGNSAGVNTSDVELNSKVALGRAARAAGRDVKRRHRLHVALAGHGAALVPRMHYRQPLARSLSQRRGFDYFGFQGRLMQTLAQPGLLDRRVESLPDDLALADRRKAGQPLTRPELGVLLAFTKIALKADLLEGGVADDDALNDE